MTEPCPPSSAEDAAGIREEVNASVFGTPRFL